LALPAEPPELRQEERTVNTAITKKQPKYFIILPYT
jgi:hypothetical protein